ncbi:AAA family ATPase, partial [Salegentibacter sp. F188]
IHDKFEINHPNFVVLRGRTGRGQTKNVIKTALKSMDEEKSKKLNNASKVLEYVGFNPIIGLKIEKFQPEKIELLMDSDEIPEFDKERIKYLLENLERNYHNDVIWLETFSSNFYLLEKLNLIELFHWESKLKKFKILKEINVYLQKNGSSFSILNASSGELSLITSFIYLSTIIDDETVVLIDEPENSLHPLWQKEYVKTFLDLFYYYQPKLIIATHSPIIVNGAEIFSKKVEIFKFENNRVLLQKKEPLNLEETYYRLFNITTPENRFLSDRVNRLLNALGEERMDYMDFQRNILKLQETAYEPKQIEVLNEILKLGKDINSENKKQ